MICSGLQKNCNHLTRISVIFAGFGTEYPAITFRFYRWQAFSHEERPSAYRHLATECGIASLLLQGERTSSRNFEVTAIRRTAQWTPCMKSSGTILKAPSGLKA